MARMSEQSLGWALLTSACLGLAFIATVAQPTPTATRVAVATPTSVPSRELVVIEATPPATTRSPLQRAPLTRQQPTAVTRTVGLINTTPSRNFPSPVTANPTTTTSTPPNTTATSPTAAPTPVVEMARSAPHGVGYVAQPLAAIATYTVTADSGGTVTLHNESSAPLLVTVDRGQALSLESATAYTVQLSVGVHQLDLLATTTSAQSYAIDGTLVTW